MIEKEQYSNFNTIYFYKVETINDGKALKTGELVRVVHEHPLYYAGR